MNKLKNEIYYYPMTGTEIIEWATYARTMCQKFNQLPADDYETQTALIRELFGTTGENVSVMQNFRCAFGFNIHVENDFFANYNCTILDEAEVKIGKNCMMAPESMICTAFHTVEPQGRLEHIGMASPVHIGDNVWIGAKAMILPGVTVGNNVVIGAGSVVTKDVPDDVVVAGNPARVIKSVHNRFQNVIVRKPAKSMIDGITSAPELGKPDYELAVKQHDDYIEALKKCGVKVTELEALEEYPDACFVEDVAVLTRKCAIITNPGAESRNGEKEHIVETIRRFYEDDKIAFIQNPGTLEGGDVMMVGDHFYIGRSARTNEEGIRQFIAILEQYGLTGSEVTLEEVLHLKTGVNYLENNTYLVSGEFINKEEFKGAKLIVIPEEEAYAANCIWVNNRVIVPLGYPKVAQAIREAGYEVIITDTSEYRKLDGGLSCLSLRF